MFAPSAFAFTYPGRYYYPGRYFYTYPAPVGAYMYPAYGYPYPYPPPYFYGPDYSRAHYTPPTVYVEKFEGTPTPQTHDEIFCPDKGAHYPEVRDCPGGWQRVIRYPETAQSGPH